MKLFRDNATGEMFISIADKKENLLHFDGSLYIGNLDNVSEVDTNGSVTKFHRQHVVEEDFDIDDDVEWHLKDVLHVPISGRTVSFRVEHISDDKVYFVTIDTVGKSTMANMNKFLNEYLSKFPKSLINRMCNVEHKVAGKVICKSKLTLLSFANVVKNTEDYDCDETDDVSFDGADDIPFDGLLTEAERCKNRNKGTCWYWLDTPAIGCSPYSLIVDYRGYPGSSYSASLTGAVVPCFALCKKHI